MQEVLVHRLGGLSLPRKSVVRLTDRPDMTVDVYHGRKTTTILFNNSVLELIIFNSNITLKGYCTIFSLFPEIFLINRNL